MIQEKTRSNLSAQESSILDDALKNVRLAFVESSGGTPASMMPKAPMGEFPMDEDYAQESPESPKTGPLPPAAEPAAPSAPAAAPEPTENKKKFTKSYG